MKITPNDLEKNRIVQQHKELETCCDKFKLYIIFISFVLFFTWFIILIILNLRN